MREVNGDLFELAANKTLVITTNGFTKADGTAVMGRGCALQAAAKWHDFPKALGERIRHGGNVVNAFRYPGYKAVFTFPVKENWWEKASLDLIRASANFAPSRPRPGRRRLRRLRRAQHARRRKVRGRWAGGLELAH